MRARSYVAALTLGVGALCVGTAGVGCHHAVESAPAPSHTLSTTTTNVVPWQAVPLDDVHAAFKAKTYDATLGAQTVKVIRVSPTRLVLITPQLDPGSYSLTLSAEGIAYPVVKLTVGTAKVVADPVATTHAVFDSLSASLANAQSTIKDARLKPTLDALAANVTRARAMFDKLDPAGQRTVAAGLVANGLDPSVAKMTWGTFGRQLLGECIELAEADAFVVIGVALGPIGLPLIACGVALAGDAGSRLGTTLNTAANEAFKEEVPAEGDPALSNAPLRKEDIVTITFTNGEPGPMPLKEKMDNFSKLDLAPGGPTYGAAMEYESALAEWPDMNTAMDPAVPPFPDLATIEPIITEQSFDATTLTIGDVTGDVSLTKQAATVDSLQLTFSSEACKASPADVSFSFSIGYPDEFSPAGRKVTIPAKLNCGCSNSYTGAVPPSGSCAGICKGTIVAGGGAPGPGFAETCTCDGVNWSCGSGGHT